MLKPVAIVRLLLILTLAFFIGPAVADDDPVPGTLDEERVDAAVKKAVEYLKGLQKDDGSWAGDSPYEGYYPFGTTALALFALVKGGEPKNSPCVQKALSNLKGRGFPGVYSTSCLILALVALVEAGDPDEESKEGEDKGGVRTVPMPDPDDVKKKNLKNSPAWLLDWIRRAVGYIIQNQAEKVWRYPGTNPGESSGNSGVGGDQDASATQFVMMALFAARRIGVSAPKSIYPKVAEFYMLNQEDKGPEVESFPVPGADLDLSKVKDLEKKWRKQFNRQLKEAERKAKKDREEFSGIEPRTVPREDPYDRFGAEGGPMNARGWTYLPKDKYNEPKLAQFMTTVTGTMTASGVIACMLCKAELEGTSWYKRNGKRLRKSIRDGMAWISKNWTISRNPCAPKEDSWRYYYYYALERAGVLSLAVFVGKHDWYREIGQKILSEQNSNGSWSGASAAPEPGFQSFSHGPIWNTCFAILFLKKATTPLIEPGTIYTGAGYGLKKQKEKNEEKEE